MSPKIQTKTPKYKESMVEKISINTSDLLLLMNKLQQTPNQLIDSINLDLTSNRIGENRAK